MTISQIVNTTASQLKRKSTEGGVVQQNKAKNELAQHLAEDPLPLRKAKITLEAALKKAEKARYAQLIRSDQLILRLILIPFKKIRAPFEAARKIAEEAEEEARQKVAEAEAYFEEVRSKPGTPHGGNALPYPYPVSDLMLMHLLLSCYIGMWWLERELHEKKKYMPTSRGGVTKK